LPPEVLLVAERCGFAFVALVLAGRAAVLSSAFEGNSHARGVGVCQRSNFAERSESFASSSSFALEHLEHFHMLSTFTRARVRTHVNGTNTLKCSKCSNVKP